MEPTGVNKILVEKYGYEWVNGKAWRPGTAPKPEVPTIDVTPGPLPDWITPPPADAFVTQALETLTNPVTGEKFTVPTGGYTVNVSALTPIEDTSPTPSVPVATPEPEPAPSEPVSLEEKIEQLQASLSELQKKYEEALQKLDQANARIAELEGKQSEPSVGDQSSSDLDPKPEANPRPEPETKPSNPEAPAVEAPEPAPTPSYPEPTGVNKILVEKYGYEWVNGKAWKPGTAPEVEIAAHPEPKPAPEPIPMPEPEQPTLTPEPTPELDLTPALPETAHAQEPPIRVKPTATKTKLDLDIRTIFLEGKGMFNIDGIYHDPSWFFVDAQDINFDGYSDLVIAPVGHLPDYGKAYDPIVLLSQSESSFQKAKINSDWDGLLFPSKVIIADLDNDNDFDIIFPANGYDAPPFPKENFGIFIQENYKFSDLNHEYPTYHHSDRGDNEGAFFHSAAVGDLNHDLLPDIFMGDMRRPFIIDGSDKLMVGQPIQPYMWSTYIKASFQGQVLQSEIIDVVGGPELELVLGGDDFTSRILEFDSSFNIINEIELENSKTFENAYVLGITSGDINADGLEDIIFSIASNDYQHGGLQVLLQTEDRHFEDATGDWFEVEPYSDLWTKTITLMDIDGDGDKDLILGQTEANDLHYYENINNNNFELKFIESPLSGWERFHVGVDEENLNVYLVNNTTNGDLFIGEIAFA
jgi:hypothetical protein